MSASLQLAMDAFNAALAVARKERTSVEYYRAARLAWEAVGVAPFGAQRELLEAISGELTYVARGLEAEGK